MASDDTHPSSDSVASGLPRRSVLKGLAAAGVTAGVGGLAGPAAGADEPGSADSWAAFDNAVASAFREMRMVGAAVAVVSADRVLHTKTFGVRTRRPDRPVTNDTHFLLASTTKSMSSLLVATYVDEGKLDWDQPVIDAWSGFRAPTDELTRTLRVRDLMGMASGIGEQPALSALHEGDPTATQLLQSIVNLPVIGRPNKQFFYNNTVYAVAGYLPLLAANVAGAELTAAYATAMQDRVYGPAGMATAQIADDPRGVVTDYAAGNGLDLYGRRTTLPYGPVGSYAPVGGTLATLNDMAAYVRLQLRKGVSVNGRRVVSQANLAECWKPHISLPLSPDLNPDVVKAGYGMGWVRDRFNDGTSLVWHNGGIDGFTSWIGFLPEHDLGLVVLNSMNPGPTGTLLYSYVLNLLLSQRLGLNRGVPEKVLDAYEAASSQLLELGSQARPVKTDAVAPYLGHYEGGYRMLRRGRGLQVRHGPRVMPLMAMPDGSYIMSGGLLVGNPVELAVEADGVPHLELVDLETVRRTVGLG